MGPSMPISPLSKANKLGKKKHNTFFSSYCSSAIYGFIKKLCIYLFLIDLIKDPCHDPVSQGGYSDRQSRVNVVIFII